VSQRPAPSFCGGDDDAATQGRQDDSSAVSQCGGDFGGELLTPRERRRRLHLIHIIIDDS